MRTETLSMALERYRLRIVRDGFDDPVLEVDGARFSMSSALLLARENLDRQTKERDALFWVLWHHQGGSSPVGQPIRRALGIGQFDHLTAEQVLRAKAFAKSQGVDQVEAQ